MQSISANLNIMIKAAEKASRALIRDFGEIEKLQVSIKGPTDFVSNADLKAEKIIIEELKKARPYYSIISEEEGSETNKDKNNTWIIDPIDGTRSYIIGRPLWGTLIGLAFKGEPLIGLVDFPALNERWLGYQSSCFFNKSMFLPKKSKLSSLSEATIASTDPDLFSDYGKQKFQDLLGYTLRNVWSGDCHNYLLLSNGGLDLVVEEGLSSYDIIPLVPVLKSQGLIITDWKGNELSLLPNKKSTFSALASNNKDLYQAALSILK